MYSHGVYGVLGARTDIGFRCRSESFLRSSLGDEKPLSIVSRVKMSLDETVTSDRSGDEDVLRDWQAE